MNRRRFLLAAGTAPITFSGVASASGPKDINVIGEEYFDAFRHLSEAERGDALVQCADALCVQEMISEETTNQIVADTEALNHHIRRARFGVRILNEYNITSQVEASMIQDLESVSREYTRFIPLIGSFNHLQFAACRVGSDPGEEAVEQFLVAALAFGLEVGLWHLNVPYKMAWGGTRFISNRTFLRYAKKSCNGCIALVMSELHWALRNIPYAVVSDDKIEFVVAQLEELRAFSKELDGYEGDISVTEEMIRRKVNQPVPSGGGFVARQNRGLFSRLLDGFSLPEISLPFAVLLFLIWKN